MPQKKILILTASPDDETKLRADQEIKAIEEELKRSKNRDKFKIIPKLAVTPDDLIHVLQDEEPPPEIVHFCGHGKKTGLVFENESGEAQTVSAEALAKLFYKFKDKVKCVLLNACYTDIQAEAIHKHIQYVIGMTEGIEDTAAIKFAANFYATLIAGRSYKDAYEFGCIALDLLGIQDNFLPVFLEKSQIILPPPQNPPTSFHYNDVIHAFKKGLVIPFLGPGIHVCDGQPEISDIELANRLAKDLEIALRPDLMGAPCQLCLFSAKELPKNCPVRKALSEGNTADYCPLANEQELAVAKLNLQCLAQYEKLRSPNIQDIYTKLEELFQLRYSTNKLHKFFANLPKKIKDLDLGYPLPYKLLVTTNYDDMLERAFREADQPFDLVFYVAEAEEHRGRFQCETYENSLFTIFDNSEVLNRERPVILKLYGAINNFVITEDHHFNYLVHQEIQKLLSLDLLEILWGENYHILFLGYSPNDINLRLIVNRLWGEREIGRKSKKSWMIHQSEPGALDQKCWDRWGVTLFSSDLKKYLTDLEQELEEKIDEELEQKIRRLQRKRSSSER